VILSLYISSVGVAIVSSSFIYCTNCIPPSAFLIYTYIFQVGFPLGGGGGGGGVYPGSC
jgi:hypothetical protein